MTYAGDAAPGRQAPPADLGPDDRLEVGQARTSGTRDLRLGVDERLGQDEHVVVRVLVGQVGRAGARVGRLLERPPGGARLGQPGDLGRRRDQVGTGGGDGVRGPGQPGALEDRTEPDQESSSRGPPRRSPQRGGSGRLVWGRAVRRSGSSDTSPAGVARPRTGGTDRGRRVDWTPSGRLLGTAANSCLLPTRTPRGQRDERRADLRGAARRPRARGSRRPAKEGLGPRDWGRAADWGPEGLRAVCEHRGACCRAGRPARSSGTVSPAAPAAARDPVRPGAVKVVAESTKAGRLPAHRRPWRPTGAHGDRLGSVQRSGSPPDRRRGHDGWSAREPAPERRRIRRGIGARPSSLAPYRAGRPSWPDLPAGERRIAEVSEQAPPRTEGTLAGRRGSCRFSGRPWTRGDGRRHGGADAMTMTKGTPDGGAPAAAARRAAGPGTPPRRRHPRARSHVPADGTPTASAVEQARTAMLHEVKPRKRTRIGADVVCEALIRQGVDVLFSLSGRRHPAALRHPRRLPGAPPHPRPPRAGRRPCRRRLRPGHRPGRRLHGDVGARRDEPGHRHRHGAARLGPDGRDHRQRAGRAHRQGRLPGDRHHRHHPADDQAQLPRPRRRRPAAGHRRGVPHRPDRPAGPGPHRHHQGRPPAGDDRRAPDRGGDRRRPARLPPDVRRPSRASSSWRPPRSPARSGR